MLKKGIKLYLLAFGLLFTVTAFASSTLDALFHHANDPIAGNRKGDVTVVEFFDYQCSHCVSMAPVIASIISSNPNVRVVFKEFPIRGPMSERASLAALAANRQGKYYVFSHALLTTNLTLSDATIMDIAKSVGLNIPQLKKDMESSAIKSQLQANFRLASELNINGTPAFFVGKTNATNSKSVNFILGEMSESELQDAIKNSGS